MGVKEKGISDRQPGGYLGTRGSARVLRLCQRLAQGAGVGEGAWNPCDPGCRWMQEPRWPAGVSHA